MLADLTPLFDSVHSLLGECFDVWRHFFYDAGGSEINFLAFYKLSC